tara:strand:+ start:864 stop:1100 length:237 start_codon:yes stop_codon:yes gene_type:complete
MTDTEILDHVYNLLKVSDADPRLVQQEQQVKDIISFIEEEWQTADYLARFQEGGAGEQGERGLVSGEGTWNNGEEVPF